MINIFFYSFLLFFGIDNYTDWDKVILKLEHPVILIGKNPVKLHDATELGQSKISSGVVLIDGNNKIITIYDCHTSVYLSSRSVGDTIK